MLLVSVAKAKKMWSLLFWHSSLFSWWRTAWVLLCRSSCWWKGQGWGCSRHSAKGTKESLTAALKEKRFQAGQNMVLCFTSSFSTAENLAWNKLGNRAWNPFKGCVGWRDRGSPAGVKHKTGVYWAPVVAARSSGLWWLLVAFSIEPSQRSSVVVCISECLLSWCWLPSATLFLKITGNFKVHLERKCCEKNYFDMNVVPVIVFYLRILWDLKILKLWLP